MPAVAPLFSVDRLDFSIEGKAILSNISFEILRGEYLGIIGPNGGGKTTLLRLLLDLASPTDGMITCSAEKSRIGYVPQRSFSDPLFPATVEEIVASGLVKRGISRTERERSIREALEKTGMNALRHRRVGSLSGGERQRVLISRALIGNPEALFLDEPTAAVDPQNQASFYRLLRELHQKGLTIVMISHDIEMIEREVDRVLCLNRYLVCHGDPGDVLHSGKTHHYEH